MIIDSFDNESEPIVTLEAFYGPKKHLVDKCVITFSKAIYDFILQEYEHTHIADLDSANGAVPVWALDHRGERIAFYLSPIGSTLAGGRVAEVNHLIGATKFVMFGSCGSLDAEKTAGTFIVPTQAYRGEGLSYYFTEPQDYIDIKNAGVVAEVFSELGLPFVQGRVWTCESMIRETVNLVNRRKEEGCIAVEMELAGVQAVCDFYGFELYDFLAAGDVLAEEAYTIDDLADANHNLDKLQIALRIIERI